MKTQNNPIIEDIIISEEKEAKCNASLKRSSYQKHRIIRNYYGGSCTYCAGIPTKKVIYDLEGYGQRVE